MSWLCLAPPWPTCLTHQLLRSQWPWTAEPQVTWPLLTGRQRAVSGAPSTRGSVYYSYESTVGGADGDLLARLKQLGISKTAKHRGVRGGRKSCRSIPVRISPRSSAGHTPSDSGDRLGGEPRCLVRPPRLSIRQTIRQTTSAAQSGSTAVPVTTSPASTSSITIELLNVQSLLTKLPDITAELQQRDPDVLCYTETNLKSGTPKRLISRPGYQMFRQDKFWSEVMVAMAQYDNSVKTEIEDIGKHCIWYSNHTKFHNIELRSWKQRGMVYINDLLKENGEILSFEEAKSMYDFNGTILDYIGLVQSLPIEWRNRQRKVKEANPIIHPNILNILSHKQGNKYIYNTLLYNKHKNARNNWELGWELELGQIDWVEVYKLNMKLTSVAYQALQYKIWTRIVATNRLLYQMGITETSKCERCRESVDTIVHKFWACPAVKLFWTEVKIFLQNIGVIQSISMFNLKTVILGNTESPIVNHVAIIGKSMRARKYILSFELFLTLLKRDMEKENYIATQKSKIREYDSKWGAIAAALCWFSDSHSMDRITMSVRMFCDIRKYV